MVPVNLDVDFENQPVEVTAEQLERFADVDGFSRYDIRVGDRRSVVQINVTYEPPIVTAQDAEAYFEAVNYPEQPVAYDEQEVFDTDELRVIAAAIRQHNREAKVVFAQFLLDF
jgi:poly-gamma-glutamate capsule biosynthesis protein CapA/YwtB (metallophosphatase superfamily)